MREGVSHAGPDLEQRKDDGGEIVAHGMLGTGRVVGEHALEIAEIFWDAMLKEGGGASLGLLLLVFVVEVGRNRMMRVVTLGDEIRDRELQRVGEEAARLILRRKAKLG